MGAVVRLGLIGVNNRALRVILPGFRASPRCVVAAVCSRDLAKARDAAREVGDAAAYDDVGALLADGDVDAVFINTPNATHYHVGMRAIAAGKHVACEKPLAETAARAEEMADAAGAAGLRTVVNFTLRSLPGPRLVSRIIRDGSLGELLGFELTTLQSRGFDARYGRADGLADLGPHLADLLTWWAGDAGAGDVSGVAATQTRLRDDAPEPSPDPSENVATHALVRLTGGAAGYLGVVRVAHGYGNAYRAQLFGSRACVEMFYDTEGVQVRVGHGAGQALSHAWREVPIPPDLAVSYADFPRLHFGRIAAALAGDEPFPDFSDGLRAQRLLDVVGEASSAGSWAPARAAPR